MRYSVEKNFFYETDASTKKQDELLLNETIFHNANGYIGVRGAYEEGYPEGYLSIRGQYINAFYDITDMKQAEALHGLIEKKQTMTNIADTQSIKIYFGNEAFSMFRGKVKSAARSVDMRRGVTVRKVDWISPEGYEFTIQFKRMTSFQTLPLFLQEIMITSHNYEGTVKLLSSHCGEVKNFSDTEDPRVADESVQYLYADSPYIEENCSYITAKTSRSGLQVCSGVGHTVPNIYQTQVIVNGKEAEHVITGKIGKEETHCFYKYSWFADSVRGGASPVEIKSKMSKIMKQPVEMLYREQEEYLSNYWENCDLQIGGDEDLNSAVHYNQYALLQSVGKDCRSNIAAKGLSGEGYEGHFFWDTEMYALPYFMLTCPDLAKNLLSFRYQTLEKAKENARMLGHGKGALYPWRTINGEECSGYFPSGTAAYHISGDIAYAVISYFLATGDTEYLYEQGAEIIVETARLWIDTGNFVSGRFQIQDVTGPDEYTCMVNNNYYTNVLAKYNLEWAVKCKDLLSTAGKWEQFCKKLNIKEEELEEFARAAEQMYLPYDEELDINPQDDSFLQKKKWDFENTPPENYPLLLHYHPLALYRRQVCKQADTVLAHFILEDYQKLSTIRKSFLYYETITTHDSSLSTCIFSIVAAKLGMTKKAYDYFGESAKLDLFNTHKNTKDGIHTANMAGNYMAIVYGFAGLRIKESGLYLAPCIPKRWKDYHFRFLYRNTKMEVRVDKKKCEIVKLAGEPQIIYIYGTKSILTDCIRIPLKRKYKGIIFDLDGVICHTDKYHYQAWKKLADELGIPFDEEINNRLRGVSRMESLEIILEKSDREFTPKEKEELADKKNEYYKRMLEQMSPKDVETNVLKTLKALRKKGYLLAIGSSSKNAEFILKQIGLWEFFDQIADGNHILHSKPDPEVFMKAAQYLGLEPEQCLVVEDAGSGIDAALAGGFDCAGLGPAAEYSRTVYPLKNFAQITELLGEEDSYGSI